MPRLSQQRKLQLSPRQKGYHDTTGLMIVLRHIVIDIMQWWRDDCSLYSISQSTSCATELVLITFYFAMFKYYGPPSENRNRYWALNRGAWLTVVSSQDAQCNSWVTKAVGIVMTLCTCSHVCSLTLRRHPHADGHHVTQTIVATALQPGTHFNTQQV